MDATLRQSEAGERKRLGTRARFVVLLLAVLGFLALAAGGMFYAIAATQDPNYKGPKKLKKPEHPYYQFK
jgi:cell division septal protein FtsQ